MKVSTNAGTIITLCNYRMNSYSGNIVGPLHLFLEFIGTVNSVKGFIEDSHFWIGLSL